MVTTENAGQIQSLKERMASKPSAEQRAAAKNIRVMRATSERLVRPPQVKR